MSVKPYVERELSGRCVFGASSSNQLSRRDGLPMCQPEHMSHR
jgi:hypothetical protein